MSKTINRTDVVTYLNRAFSLAVNRAQDSGRLGKQATRKSDGRKMVTTKLYDLQVEFAYLIDNIERSPAYIVAKYITEANELIDQIKAISTAGAAA